MNMGNKSEVSAVPVFLSLIGIIGIFISHDVVLDPAKYCLYTAVLQNRPMGRPACYLMT